jgi:hypothetical protein
VKESGHCQNLSIMRDLSLSGETHGKEPRPDGVIEQVRLGTFARVLDCTRNERRMGHKNTCHQADHNGTIRARIDFDPDRCCHAVLLDRFMSR